MTSILFIRETILDNQFRCHYPLPSKKKLSIFFSIYEIKFKFWRFSKKKMTVLADVFTKLETLENVVR